MKIAREVTLTDLLGVVGLLGAIVAGYNLTSSKIAGLEVRAADEEKERRDLKQDVTERLDRIEKKLDRIVEKK